MLLSNSISKLQTLYSVLIVLLISGCGLHPVYDTSSPSSEKSIIKSGIKVSAATSGTTSTLPTSSDSSFDNSSSASMSRQFTNNLEDLLNSPAASPSYKLDVSLTYSSVGVGVARDGTASRYNLVINSSYKLTRIADGKEVDNGTVSSVNSYNNPNNQYFSTYISEQDARKRGVKELAELYRHRMLSFVEKADIKSTKKN